MSYINFVKKNGEVETGKINLVGLDTEIENLKRAMEQNASQMIDLQQERARLSQELDKLLAVKGNLPL